MIKRGRVLRDTNAGPGLLTVEGAQYTFVLEGMWRSEIPPRPGMPVDITFSPDGSLEAVAAVSESQAAREHAQKAISGALRHSETVKTNLMKTSFASRFEISTLIAEGGMLLSFFVLPNLKVGSIYARTSLTGWEAVGFSPNTMSGSDHGVLSLLAIVCLFAPMAVPLFHRTWTRWLNAAPLAFVLIAVVNVALQIQTVGHAASRNTDDVFGGEVARAVSQQVSGMFTVAIGAYLVLLCSIFIGSRALRKIG